MRPQSEIRVTLAAALVDGAGTTKQLAQRTGWSIGMTRRALDNMVTAGDVYHCAGGPPGHRFLAADPAALIDFTPAAAVRSGVRVQGWRPLGPPVDRRRTPRREPRTVEVAPLL